MAKIEIEEARIYAFLENVIANHERFKANPLDQRLIDLASSSVFGVCFLFNVDPRDVPHIIESILEREKNTHHGERDFRGMIFYDKLKEKAGA